ncbi:MAG TPA: hypothetical protein PK413_02295 [Thermoanaerobaculia bacterium]|nr:hypothetical protein [Thermoanaerobaculia bacterium]
MKRSTLLAHSILWAAAILASALLGAPSTLTLLLLPSLATISWVVSLRDSPAASCRA